MISLLDPGYERDVLDMPKKGTTFTAKSFRRLPYFGNRDSLAFGSSANRTRQTTSIWLSSKDKKPRNPHDLQGKCQEQVVFGGHQKTNADTVLAAHDSDIQLLLRMQLAPRRLLAMRQTQLEQPNTRQ